MNRQEILEKIEQSQMVLAGLGEDFDISRSLSREPGYIKGRKILEERGLHWLIPGWNEYFGEQSGDGRTAEAVNRLFSLLEGKNWYAVSVSCSRSIFREERVVMPCGSVLRKQCEKGCGDVPEEVTAGDREKTEAFFRKLSAGDCDGSGPELGTCPECGGELIFNNIYAENYNEKGYLEQWKKYTKWLQGTLNRRIVILELGVGMRFPTVIRWPFEKVAFFNQKAWFYRINEKLYQLTKELDEKGCGIAQNAIDWLEQL